MAGMLQIRLSKGSSGDGGGGGGGGAAGKPAATAAAAAVAETVTVACPDHLVLADLPVAKSLGAVTSSAHPALRSLGRRSRRAPGERVHLCVRCDFPIAIYGRLIPCEHAFCLACARSDSSCYLCDERIQKIQTIKIMEGIFICAAPHCLKSFLKKSEFELHIHEIHADLLQPQTEKEVVNEADVLNIPRPSSTDPHKQSPLPESSTARAPPRPAFSPSSNSQLQDREDKNRRYPSRDPPPPKPPLQPKPPPLHSRHQNQPGDPQPENNPSQGFDRPYNWVNLPQSFDNQSALHYNRDSSQIPPDKQTGVPSETPFSTYPPLHPLQPPNYPVAMNVNQAPVPTLFNFPAFPTDGSQSYYGTPQETPQREKVPENGTEQGSVLGFPPAPAGIAGFPDNFPRPWGMGFMGVPFEPLQVAQGIPEGFANPVDSQGGVPFFQGGYPQMPQGLPLNPTILAKESEMKVGVVDQNDGKGVLAPLPLLLPLQLPLSLPPPPPLPPPISQQLNNNSKFPGSSDVNREGQGYGWQSDNRGFGNVPD